MCQGHRGNCWSARASYTDFRYLNPGSKPPCFQVFQMELQQHGGDRDPRTLRSREVGPRQCRRQRGPAFGFSRHAHPCSRGRLNIPPSRFEIPKNGLITRLTTNFRESCLKKWTKHPQHVQRNASPRTKSSYRFAGTTFSSKKTALGYLFVKLPSMDPEARID